MVTTALVGASGVALFAGSALPDAKSVSPTVLDELKTASALSEDAAERANAADRSSRDGERFSLEAETGVWCLPLKDYEFNSPYGVQGEELHTGVDLAAPEGTPYVSIHDGTVTKAGWFGGYGYTVIVANADGSEAIYGHSSTLSVQEGQQVKAGDQLGLVGNTGLSYGAHLHLEVHVKGEPLDPVPWLMERGVDIQLQMEPFHSEVTTP